jgi:hypothetical protein
MKTFLVIGLLAAATTTHAAVKVKADALLFAETFNEADDRVELKNGAKLDGEGSGVSGLPADKCYVADSVVTNDGPVGVIHPPVAVQGLEELTITVWYKPQASQAYAASLFNLAQTYLIKEKNNTWTARVAATQIPKEQRYWFGSGGKGAYRDWLAPGEWIFLALVWKKSGNEVCYFQGTKSGEVKKGNCPTRDFPVGGLRAPGRNPDVVGNSNSAKCDRPFHGSIDNVRVYSKALDEATLEQIRDADAKNEMPPAF